MNFPFNVYLAAWAGSFLASYASVPLWRAFCRSVGLIDDPGHRKIHSSPVPLAGGFAVLTGMVVPLLVGLAVLYKFNAFGEAMGKPLLAHGFSRRGVELAVIVAGGLGMLILGSLDDRFELKPLPKFGGQLVIAAFVAAAGVRITLFVHSPAFSYAVTILWILTVINAFNFMDNMNGLCGGLGCICSFCFAAIAAVEGQYLVTLLALLTCGALLGFLPYNFPNASAFLGDAGSHLVGYLLAVTAILPHYYTHLNPRPLAVLIPLLILAVPLGDMAWVVVLRWRLGLPFYQGDNNHLSHRLVRAGYTKARAVMLIWLLAAAAGIIGTVVVL